MRYLHVHEFSPDGVVAGVPVYMMKSVVAVVLGRIVVTVGVETAVVIRVVSLGVVAVDVLVMVVGRMDVVDGTVVVVGTVVDVKVVDVPSVV